MHKQSFTKSTLNRLGHYVYALVDPTDNSIFYVGKASGTDRGYNHLKASKSEHAKSMRIERIRAMGQSPVVEILRFGLLSAAAAHEVESAVIDSIGLENLTNAVRGHGAERGRLSASEAERLLGSRPVDVGRLKESFMLFFINQTFSPTLGEQQLYDSTRQFWFGVAKSIRAPREATAGLPVQLALAIVDSVVVRVYSIAAWFPAGTTLSTREWCGTPEDNRWEFVGNIIEKHRLLGRRLQREGLPIAANELGFGYINRPNDAS